MVARMLFDQGERGRGCLDLVELLDKLLLLARLRVGRSGVTHGLLRGLERLLEIAPGVVGLGQMW